MSQEDEKRLVAARGGCPTCGHSILNHHSGKCCVPISKGKRIKWCNCTAIQPPNTVLQGRLEGL